MGITFVHVLCLREEGKKQAWLFVLLEEISTKAEEIISLGN